MNTVAIEQATNTWRDCYRAALFEPNKSNIPMRIAIGEQRIALEARELFNSGKNDISERSAMNVALFALQALRSSLDWTEGESERRSNCAVA